MSPTLNFVYCFTRFIERGADFTCVSMYFKIMSKVIKYTCRIRRYNYTHNQLNTRHINIMNFLRGWAQNLSLPLGRQLPSLRHCGEKNQGGYDWASIGFKCCYISPLNISKEECETYRCFS